MYFLTRSLSRSKSTQTPLTLVKCLVHFIFFAHHLATKRLYERVSHMRVCGWAICYTPCHRSLTMIECWSVSQSWSLRLSYKRKESLWKFVKHFKLVWKCSSGELKELRAVRSGSRCISKTTSSLSGLSEVNTIPAVLGCDGTTFFCCYKKKKSDKLHTVQPDYCWLYLLCLFSILSIYN